MLRKWSIVLFLIVIEKLRMSFEDKLWNRVVRSFW